MLRRRGPYLPVPPPSAGWYLMITFLVAELAPADATTLADHEFCLTTITPGRHCWCCWRICDAVCWAMLGTAGLNVGVIETDTIAGWPLGLLDDVCDAGDGVAEVEVVAAAAAATATTGVVRNFRYGSS